MKRFNHKQRSEKRGLSYLRQENEQLRKELKELSLALDDAIQSRKTSDKRIGNNATRDRELQNQQVQIQQYQKEISTLKRKAELNSIDRMREVQDSIDQITLLIRETALQNKEIERKVHEAGNRLNEVNTDPEEVKQYQSLVDELRVVRENVKRIEFKQEKQVQVNKRMHENLNQAEQEAQALGINTQSASKQESFKNFDDDEEPVMAPVDNSDILGIQKKILSLENEIRQRYGKNRKALQLISEKILECQQEGSNLQKHSIELEKKYRICELKIKKVRREIKQIQMGSKGPQMEFHIDKDPPNTVPTTTKSKSLLMKQYGAQVRNKSMKLRKAPKSSRNTQSKSLANGQIDKAFQRRHNQAVDSKINLKIKNNSMINQAIMYDEILELPEENLDNKGIFNQEGYDLNLDQQQEANKFEEQLSRYEENEYSVFSQQPNELREEKLQDNSKTVDPTQNLNKLTRQSTEIMEDQKLNRFQQNQKQVKLLDDDIPEIPEDVPSEVSYEPTQTEDFQNQVKESTSNLLKETLDNVEVENNDFQDVQSDEDSISQKSNQSNVSIEAKDNTIKQSAFDEIEKSNNKLSNALENNQLNAIHDEQVNIRNAMKELQQQDHEYLEEEYI